LHYEIAAIVGDVLDRRHRISVPGEVVHRLSLKRHRPMHAGTTQYRLGAVLEDVRVSPGRQQWAWRLHRIRRRANRSVNVRRYALG
jgi:hypothetical protein